MENLNFSELKKQLDLFGKEYIKELTKELINADKKATGKLIKSLDYRLVEVVDGYILEILSEDYLKYVDEGRKPGRMPPTRSLDKWVIARRIAPRDKNGKFLKREQVKFLIARSIGKNGIKPTNVIRKSLDSIYSKKSKLIAKAAAEDVLKVIDKMFSEIK